MQDNKLKNSVLKIKEMYGKASKDDKIKAGKILMGGKLT